ncbi:tetratricopeptide repeat protein, partial [Legionella spiritensis]
MPDTKREKTKLDIKSHSNSELVKLISQQMLEGDYSYASLWISIVNFSKRTPETRESRQIQALINDLREQCEDRIKEDDSHAMIIRGGMHRLGFGGPVELNKAIALYDKAIELNNPAAMNSRAFMHEEGRGGPVNYPEAIRLYEMAIVLGDATAMNNRAVMHRHGQGGPVNYLEAIRLFEMAINEGVAAAMYNRALMHRYGQGGPVNYPEAIRLYEMAIKLGDAAAMYNRAWMHQKGLGGPVNYPEAIRLYEMAIELGHAGAMKNRAFMHKNGQGGPVNYPEAIRLYEMANRQGSTLANSNLSDIYELESVNNADTALKLLDVIWDDLLAGLSFTEHTLTLLGTHCKKDVLARLTDKESRLGTNLKFISQLITNHDHPLTKILDHGKSLKSYSQYL